MFGMICVTVVALLVALFIKEDLRRLRYGKAPSNEDNFVKSDAEDVLQEDGYKKLLVDDDKE